MKVHTRKPTIAAPIQISMHCLSSVFNREFDLSAGGKTKSSVQKASSPLHIVNVSAEFAPVAKVGGLADVVTGTEHLKCPMEQTASC